MKEFVISTTKKETAILVGLITSTQNERKTNEYLDELEFLAQTAGAEVVKRFTQRIDHPHPVTYVGTGKLKEIAEQYGTSGCSVGSGWLLSAEIVAWVHAGYPKVLAALPFACLPGHIYGRGQYASLQRKLPNCRIVGVDYDASIRDGTVQTRVRMLLDDPL